MYPCPRCSGELRMLNFCMDRDGIRPARVCTVCKTAWRSTSSSLIEFLRHEYTDNDMYDWPEHVRVKEAEEFHRVALMRGYVKAPPRDNDRRDNDRHPPVPI